MKKIYFILSSFSLVVLFALLTSCPSSMTIVPITISPADTVLEAGDSVSFSILLTPDELNGGELGMFTISEDSTVLFTKEYSGISPDSLTYKYVVATTAIEGDVINLMFETIDSKSELSNTVQTTIEVIVHNISPILADDIALTYVATSINESSFLIAGTDSVTYGNDDDVDLVYVYNEAYGYGVMSPNASWVHECFAENNEDWIISTKKETKVQKYTGSIAFEDFTAESINELTITNDEVYEGSGNGCLIEANDIVVFKTSDGRKGVLLITSSSKITTNIEGSVKYQSEANSSK